MRCGLNVWERFQLKINAALVRVILFMSGSVQSARQKVIIVIYVSRWIRARIAAPSARQKLNQFIKAQVSAPQEK